MILPNRMYSNYLTLGYKFGQGRLFIIPFHVNCVTCICLLGQWMKLNLFSSSKIYAFMIILWIHFCQKQDNSRMIILADKLSTITWWTDKMFEIGLKLKLPSLGIKSRNKKAVSSKQILSAPNSGSLKDSKVVRSRENSQSIVTKSLKPCHQFLLLLGIYPPFSDWRK